jgi:aminopeptidase YwaD
MRALPLLLALFSAIPALSQKIKKEDRFLIENLKAHVNFLSSDKLEGRRAGSEGEKLAASYIAEQFKATGLLPKGTNGYEQAFDINEGNEIKPATHFIIDGNELIVKKDFFPLGFSSNGSITAMPSLALQEPNTPWFFDIAEMISENRNNPHFDLASAIAKRSAALQSKGASALIIYNSSNADDALVYDGREKITPLNIPVIYLNKAAAKKYLSDSSASLDLKLKVETGPKMRTGRNVIGYIDNKAANTIVLGAHFDHLGWGEDNNSLYRNGPKQIHNGADDNASGTAALIELARLLKASKNKQNNYLFVAFSGEELGLFGSKYFVENPTIGLSSINYMINMDMLGRLNDTNHVVTVGGYGTTTTWGELFRLTGKKKLYADKLAFRFDSSGTGPSDHTSFYRKGIPVLFYFTGLHADYHKPTDDADKINYHGQAAIVKHILSVIDHTDKSYGKLGYLKTRETNSTTSARFSVTLGIMPDYTFSGAGVRVDGVSDNKPAQKAGLKTGDVITALGENKISSLEHYMQALGKFKSGEKTTVSFVRGNDTLTATVEF